MKKNSPKRGYARLRTARNGSFLLFGYFPSLGGLARIALEARRGIYSILILKGKQWEEITLRIGRARKRAIRMLSVQRARSAAKESLEAHAVVLSSAKRVLRRNLTIASDGSRKWNFEDRLRDGSIVTGEGTCSKGRDRKAKLIRRRTDAKGKEVWTTKSETTWGVGNLSATVSKITSKRSDGTSGQTRKVMWQDAAGWHSRAQTSWSKQGGGRTSSGKGGASTDHSSDCGMSSTGSGVTTTWTTLTTNSYADGSQQSISMGETEDRSYDGGVSTQFQSTSMEVGSDEQITGASNSSGESWTGPGISIQPTTSTGDEAGSGPNEGPYFKGQGSWGTSDEGPFSADPSVTGESGVESKSDTMGTATQTGWADSDAGHSDTIVQTNEDGSQTITTTTTDKNGDGTQHTTELDPDGNETSDSTKEVHGSTGDSGGSSGGNDNSGTSGGSNNSGGSGGSGDGQGGDNAGDNGDKGSGGPQAPEGGGGGESGMDWDEGGGSEGSPRTLPKHAGHVIDEIDGGEDSGGRGDGGEGDGGESGDFGPRMGSLLVKIVDAPDGDGEGPDTTPQHPVDVSHIKIKAPPGADEGGWGGTNDPRVVIAFTANLIAGLTRSKGLSPQDLANLSRAALLNRSLGAQAAGLTTLNKI